MIKKGTYIFFISLIFIIGVSSSQAVPPHPRLYLKQMENAFSPMLNAVGANTTKFIDPDYSRQDYDPQPDGLEYILAIRVDFSDQPGQKSASTFNDAIFGNSGSSMRLYFQEVSYGQMQIEPGYMNGVIPTGNRWYRMSKPMSYYGAGNVMTDRYEELAIEACKTANADIDFSKYDRNKDGFLDHLMIIHSGNDEAYTGVQDDIWSAVLESVYGTYDGVQLSSVMIVAEDPNNDFINVGIYCHEFFHEFGAPDVYQFSWNYPGGQWCLMAQFGPYQDDGRHPSHICGYLKWDFDANPLNGIKGWIKPETLTFPGTYALDSFELPKGNRLYKIDIPDKKGKEYFLMENRNEKAPGTIYDTYLPESGIVIWHIDETQPLFYSNPPRAWVEDPTDPDRKNPFRATKGAAYSANDEQTSFTPSTNPNSNANDGSYSGIIITDIGNEGDKMPFTLYFKDTYEPNDSIDTAYGPLDYNNNYFSFIQKEQDVDFYKFRANSGSNILIFLENIPEDCNYDLNAYDTQGNIVAISDKLGYTPEVISFEARSSGIYYVAVVPKYGFNSTQQYLLIIDSISMAPEVIAVSKAYPNPGPDREGALHFQYKLLEDADKLTLSIYTAVGTLIYTDTKSPENITGEIVWNVRDNDSFDMGNKKISSGIYIYVLKASLNGKDYIKTGKIALIY